MSASVVAFCMQGVGHLQMLLPLVHGLSARGCLVHVFTHGDFRSAVERAGGRFVDLFARHPIDAADATSIPVPCRFVSFAGVYAERVAEEVAALEPDLVAYDTFSVVAPVVARRLELRYVSVIPNHAPVPARVLAALGADPRVAISESCHAAVRRLREVHGFREAHPFSYVDALSPHLNLYAEPAEFLAAGDRVAFEPVAFLGSLAPALRDERGAEVFPRKRRRLRIYVSFGTVIWWYFAPAAVAALQSIAEACAALDADVVIGLGGHRLDAAVAATIARENVTLRPFADQWTALRETDLVITHHGLNSTHEAIYHRVPMLSYPFFGDQPALARRCQELRLALPLVEHPQAPLTPDIVITAIERVERERHVFATHLAQAQVWELRTIAERDQVIEKVLALTRRS